MRINNKVFSHLYTNTKMNNEFVWDDDKKGKESPRRDRYDKEVVKNFDTGGKKMNL